MNIVLGNPLLVGIYSFVFCTVVLNCAPKRTSTENGASSSSFPGVEVAWGEQNVDQSLFAAVAVNPGQRPPSLVIIQQKPNRRPCWSEDGVNPVLINPLLLTFPFQNDCGRATDGNGYGIMVGGLDKSLSHPLRVRIMSGDLVLVGESSQYGDYVIGRTHGLSNSVYTKIQLDPGWKFTLRTYNGKPTGLIYFSN